MLRCRDIVKYAEAYLSGEMTGWQRLGFRLHLLSCRACRRYVAHLRATRAVSVRLHADVSASPESVDHILALLAQQDKHHHPS